MKTFIGPLKKYATFSGRASRKEFWGFFGWSLLIGLALGFLEGFLGIAPEFEGSLFSIVLTITLLLPWTALIVRRLHDLGRSGWWYLLLWVPLVNLGMLIYMCKRGKDDNNPYGSPGDL